MFTEALVSWINDAKVEWTEGFENMDFNEIFGNEPGSAPQADVPEQTEEPAQTGEQAQEPAQESADKEKLGGVLRIAGPAAAVGFAAAAALFGGLRRKDRRAMEAAKSAENDRAEQPEDGSEQ